MKTLKKLVLLFTITLSLSAIAQNDPKALLKEVSAKAKSYENIAIDFKYVLENTAENVKQTTKGDVIMEGDKYVLNILGVTRIFDGVKLFSISVEDEEVTISKNNKEQDDVVTPSQMLTFYESGYTYKMDIEQNINGRKIQYIKLTPIDSKSEVKYILLGIDKQTKHIYNLIQVGKNDTKTTLTVTSFKTNTPISKNLFTFNAEKYKSFYINELD